MKDHEIAQLVNALRDCAVEFHDAQQLRERIAALVVPALQGLRTFARMRFGYAPGDYSNVCIQCKRIFVGDRRSHVCDQCADAACSDQLPVLQQRSAAVGAESVALWGSALFADALQQSSSGITAGSEKLSQVVDFGAAAQNRTADLLITNQDKNTPETSDNQDVTPKTATAQPAQVAPTESSGCEGVTAALDLIKMALSDAGRLTGATEEAFPKLTRLARDSLIKAHDAWHDVAAQWAERDNFRWITIAHMLCTDAGVPQGHIADRLEGLRAALQAKQKQSVDITRTSFGTYEVRMNCVTDTVINGLGGGFPAHLQSGETFVCTLGADFTVDGKPMPIRDVLVAWANYMGKQLVFTGPHETGEFTT